MLSVLASADCLPTQPRGFDSCSPPQTSRPITPPQPVEQSSPPDRRPFDSTGLPHPPWLVVTLPVPQTSDPSSAPRPSTPSATSGSSFPLAPPQSSDALAPSCLLFTVTPPCRTFGVSRPLQFLRKLRDKGAELRTQMIHPTLDKQQTMNTGNTRAYIHRGEGE